MSVWYCIPSKRPPEEAEKVLKLWRERGYKIALWCDSYNDAISKKCDVFIASESYLGYAIAVNALIYKVMENVPDAEWFVTGGDDISPDPNFTAEEIARQCSGHFQHVNVFDPDASVEQGCTFGVMQPTGDRWLVNGPGTQPGIDLVAGSPWMGRGFCWRINQGKGPLWPEYFHCGEDEELQHVATKLGIFWQRPDLTHYHDHWGRPRPGERIGQADRMPEFLARANSIEEWNKYKKLFSERLAAGFPGHEPIA